MYQPNTTVNLLYPGTRVNADGTIADVPGWNLNSAGFWVRDPSDEFLRAGITLTYTVNPTATAFVTYPPESSNCANPDGPFPPTVANRRRLVCRSPSRPAGSRRRSCRRPCDTREEAPRRSGGLSTLRGEKSAQD